MFLKLYLDALRGTFFIAFELGSTKILSITATADLGAVLAHKPLRFFATHPLLKDVRSRLERKTAL